MSTEENTTGTALAINTQEKVDRIIKEVQDEFITSDEKVYKAGLRSLIIQEQKLIKQKNSIDTDIKHLHDARDALTLAFKNGELHSVEDARGVVRSVNKNIDARDINVEDDFE